MRKKASIWSPKNYVVVHAQYAGEQCMFSASVVTKAGEVEKEPVEFESLELLVAHFGKSVAYWLHIDGTGVLSRIVETQSDYKRDLIINGNSDEFYFTTLPSEQTKLVSFVRKSVAEDLVNYFTTSKLFLVGISCGFTPIGVLLDATESISIDYLLERTNGTFVRLERLDEAKQKGYFQGNYYTKPTLIAKAIIAGVTDVNSLFEPFLFEKNQLEFKEFSKFKKIGITSILSILLILIINYFYVNHLNTEIANKEQEISLSNSNLSILDKLKQEEIRKQQLVVNSGVVTTNFISFYLDEIGKDVPKDIRLSEMYVFPVKEKLKEKRKVEIDQTKIEILGWTKSNIVLDDWIERLNRQDWVKSVELLNYQKLANDESSFKMILFLAE